MAWTVWDRWTITGNITLRELLDWLKEKGLNAYSISCGTSLLYNSMFPRHKERLDKKVVDVAREVAKVEVPPYRRHLDIVVACEDDDDNDVDIPLVSIYFRGSSSSKKIEIRTEMEAWIIRVVYFIVFSFLVSARFGSSAPYSEEAVATAIYLLFSRRKKDNTVKPWATGLSGQLKKAFVTGVPSLERAELEAACEGFINVVGILPECTLYKGTLSSGVEIAVLSTSVNSAQQWSAQSEEQFRNKISVLSKVNHKNFMNLLGYCACDEPFTRMMVFEYTPCGSLFEHLHIREAEHLDWKTRLRIIMGVAYCLEHMSQLDPPSLLPTNLSTSCIYLTEDYAAKIADIEFWKDDNKHDAASSRETQISQESVVYKFGILLLEVISGRRPISEDDRLLVLWASSYLDGKRPLSAMADRTLVRSSSAAPEKDVAALCDVVRQCVRPEAGKRAISMGEVATLVREVAGLSPEQAAPRENPLWWAELEIASSETG
ncbi:hypothetical protein E2562_033858 [Oryza meyeriana var. granulata]|uniref:Protein kinase domain-containing protein n=1 Tax=Oryza meyeriana var. granulata TaxID=110450 RepID=A0A6G1BPI7_9ORYZ|nr:hypothetical protein E2562_033858 [Oryza meyeriana var. granulata]